MGVKLEGKDSESIELMENSDLSIRALSFKNRAKAITVESKRVIVDQLNNLDVLDEEFSGKLLTLLGNQKIKALGINLEVEINPEEQVKWQEFFSNRMINFINEREVKNFGLKFQIIQKEHHSSIINIATAINDNGNLYMRMNSQYDNIGNINIEILKEKWTDSLNLLKQVITKI